MGFYNRYANIKIGRPDEETYPKWIDHKGGSLLVHSSQEERALLNVPVIQENPKGFGESLGNNEEYKAKLLQEALDLGIPARKTWGISKLQKAIHDHSE